MRIGGYLEMRISGCFMMPIGGYFEIRIAGHFAVRNHGYFYENTQISPPSACLRILATQKSDKVSISPSLEQLMYSLEHIEYKKLAINMLAKKT
ncbi:hypothetical protein H8L32_21590 [Undibacterium sp. CY18W]|uniref:Uncharacterized protein n=1 Tax=Undibacterium hunanense TaxID=2762292 RepID=A0ABR6ZW34_9BURK|nr:hypothetical protein [Undibacterium hunanense]MBC3920075.1 hypothetical protein [Undibacterium hunanense]